jgi:hypothetical protein
VASKNLRDGCLQALRGLEDLARHLKGYDPTTEEKHPIGEIRRSMETMGQALWQLWLLLGPDGSTYQQRRRPPTDLAPPGPDR